MSLWYLHKKDSSNKFQKFWWVHRKPLIQISANLTPFIPTPHTLPGLCHPGKVKALRHGPKKWQKAKATKGDPDFWFWILMVKWLVHFLFNCGPKKTSFFVQSSEAFWHRESWRHPILGRVPDMTTAQSRGGPGVSTKFPTAQKD